MLLPTTTTTAAALRALLKLPSSLRRNLYTSTGVNAAAAKLEHFDIVCIGGGPVGLGFANALRANSATESLRIALVDSQDLTSSREVPDPINYSNRCSSLTPAAVRSLDQWGVSPLLDHGRLQSYHAMNIWDGVSGSKIHFNPVADKPASLADIIPNSRPYVDERSGQRLSEGIVATMCENNNLTAALLARLKELAPLEMIDKAGVSSITSGTASEDDHTLNLSQRPIVKLSSGRYLAARLLVGADGANSPVRTFAGISSDGWDYGRHGVVATLTLDKGFGAHDLRTAYQRFLPTGPIALLPLPCDKASLVWSTTVAQATKLKQLSPPDFAAMVNAAYRLLPVDVEYMVEQISSGHTEQVAWREKSTNSAELGLPRLFPRVIDVQSGSVASFPLRMRHAATYTGHRVALLGDAAHTIHPLAGQGLNLGLADAESLANCVINGVETGMDVGSSWCLDQYNSDRWAANNAMLGVVDKLHKLYSASTGPIVWGRSIGLSAVDKLGPLKSFLMGVAAGR